MSDRSRRPPRQAGPPGATVFRTFAKSQDPLHASVALWRTEDGTLGASIELGQADGAQRGWTIHLVSTEEELATAALGVTSGVDDPDARALLEHVLEAALR